MTLLRFFGLEPVTPGNIIVVVSEAADPEAVELDPDETFHELLLVLQDDAGHLRHHVQLWDAAVRGDDA